jgi:hypothetical protein
VRSVTFCLLGKEMPSVPINGHDCPKFESLVAGNLTRIGIFGNQWQLVAFGDNGCHLFGSHQGG